MNQAVCWSRLQKEQIFEGTNKNLMHFFKELFVDEENQLKCIKVKRAKVTAAMFSMSRTSLIAKIRQSLRMLKLDWKMKKSWLCSDKLSSTITHRLQGKYSKLWKEPGLVILMSLSRFWSRSRNSREQE